MKETNLENANLTASIFENCNLDQTIFNDTNLTTANFSTSHHFKIDPEYNILKNAKFSSDGLLGLLDKYDIKIV